MKKVYPIVIEKGKKYLVVHIPDFDISTQGFDIPDAIEMARDAIGIVGLELEDNQEEVPNGTDLENINVGSNQIKTLVDVDFSVYRRQNDLRTVRKNCTIPSWLCYEAEQHNINFSNVLQEALKEKIGIK